jgi:hypothetical protein
MRGLADRHVLIINFLGIFIKIYSSSRQIAINFMQRAHPLSKIPFVVLKNDKEKKNTKVVSILHIKLLIRASQWECKRKFSVYPLFSSSCTDCINSLR